MVNLFDVNSQDRPHFTSFVAVAGIVSTSTIIPIAMSNIAGVNVMPV